MLGIGLAMDAFSVSLANGLNEPDMKPCRICGVAAVFSVFQFAMPLIGWILVCTVSHLFGAFETFIPWIALALLGYIGGKMLWESLHDDGEEEEQEGLGLKALMIQGVATSIDALAMGVTLNLSGANICLAAPMIAVTTAILSPIGLKVGNLFGTKYKNKAELAGGIVLVGLGIKILLEGLGIL